MHFSSQSYFAAGPWLFFFLCTGMAFSARAQDNYTFTDADVLALQEILTAREKKTLAQLPSLAEKNQWIRLYWKRRDPTPTTPGNERLQEFLRRLTYARQWYHAPNKKGFDDRGKIYLKYGEPTEKYVEPLGDMIVKPNESWSYSALYPGLVFDFVSRGVSYRLVDDLSRALGARTRPEMEMPRLVALYESRSQLDPVYGRIASDLRSIMNQGDIGAAGMITDAQQQLAEYTGEASAIKSEVPPAVYKYKYDRKPLAIALSIGRFRAAGGKVRTEFYYGVAFNQLAFERAKKYWETHLRGVVAVFDSAYRFIATDSIRVRLIAPTEAAKKTAAYLSQSNFYLPPGQYHLSVRLENQAANRLGILRADFTCPPFPAETLAMSDLQLSPNIVIVPESAIHRNSPEARFIKQDLRITPLPGMTVSRSQMLHVYFEIYNLALDASNRTKFELNYTLKKLAGSGYPGAASGQTARLSITETRAGSARDEKTQIGIDLSQQTAGQYLLELTTKDLNSKTETHSSVPLRIAGAN